MFTVLLFKIKTSQYYLCHLKILLMPLGVNGSHFAKHVGYNTIGSQVLCWE